MADLKELEIEQRAISAELRANQATTEDIDSTVDDIQRSLNRNAALTIRLSAVQRKIAQAQAAIAEDARAKKVAEGAKLKAIAEGKSRAIVDSALALRTLILEQHEALDAADSVLSSVAEGHYSRLARRFGNVVQAIQGDLEAYDSQRFTRVSGYEGISFVDKGAR